MNMTFWIHEISQSALAGAVAMLGIVILLELRSVLRLRRSVDGHLSRVFEQLDLLRFENQQLLEAQARVPPPAPPESPSTPAVTLASSPPLAGGEARLMAALAAARARSVVHQKTA